MSIPGAASPLFLATTAGAADAFEISRSLRFNSADSAHLNRTPSSASNQKTWTWSGWVKLTNLTAQSFIFAAGSSPYVQIYTTSASIFIQTNQGYLATAQVFRDPSAWQHWVFAFDTTQATASNRIKFYVNGSEVTTWTTDQRANITQNVDTAVNSAVNHAIGKQLTGSAYSNFLLTEINFIDGQALAPTDFGKTDDNGVWQAKDTAGLTFGTNGFRLQFADNSGATATTLGKDTSGGSNNWTPNNLSVTAGAGNDSLVDSPTNGTQTDTGAGGQVVGNYAVLNPLHVGHSTLTNGNLDASGSSDLPTIIPGSGQWYYEIGATGYNWDGTAANFTSSAGSYNFGQRPFSGTPNSGYKALCTANLPGSTIADSSTAMDVVLNTGANILSTAQGAIGGSADLLWIKDRANTNNHQLIDTVRGGTITLQSNTNSGDTTYGAPSGSSVGWTWSAGANSNKTYAITVANPGSGNKYYADGALQPTLTLAEGSTYKFDQSAATNSGHPLRFSTTSDGTHGGGSEYTTGVTTAGTPGSAGAFTQIVIAASAPTLYAYCTNHSGMGFQVNTSDTAGFTIPVGSISSAITNSAQTWSSNITTTGNSGSWWPSYPATYIFDANTSNYGHANGNGSVAAVVTLSFSPAVTCLSTVSFFGGLTGSGTGTISINGGTAFNLTTGSSATTKTTVAFSGSISSIVVTKTATGGQGLLVYGFEIDGVRLADNTGWSLPASPSIASRVKASPGNGFSIVSYDYPASGSFTVGHGLSNAPAVIIYKNTNRATSWFVYHSAATSKDQYLILNGTNAVTAGTNFWGASAPTNAVFGSTVGVTGISTDESIAYCFTPVEGYSSMGSFQGNGSADGTFVYTGFKIRWLMVKSSSNSGGHWLILDTARDPHNLADATIYANLSNAEAQASALGIDILSNGFKPRGTDAGTNASGYTYIYIAFAENPFASNGGLAR